MYQNLLSTKSTNSEVRVSTNKINSEQFSSKNSKGNVFGNKQIIFFFNHIFSLG